MKSIHKYPVVLACALTLPSLRGCDLFSDHPATSTVAPAAALEPDPGWNLDEVAQGTGVRVEIGACGAASLCAVSVDPTVNARLFWQGEVLVLVLEPDAGVKDTVTDLRVADGLALPEPIARMLGRTAITLQPGAYPIHRTESVPGGFVELEADPGEPAIVDVPMESAGETVVVSPALFSAITEWTALEQKDFTLLEYVDKAHPKLHEDALAFDADFAKHQHGDVDGKKKLCRCAVVVTQGYQLVSPTVLDESHHSWSTPYNGAQHVRKYGFRARGLGALGAEYAYAYVKKDNAQITAQMTGGTELGTNYTGLRMTNLCEDVNGFKTDCGCPMAVDYRAEYHAQLHLANHATGGTHQKAGGEAVAHAAALLTTLGSSPTMQILFDRELGATQATNQTVDYSGLISLVGTVGGIAYTLGAGPPVTSLQVGTWATDVANPIFNGLIVHSGNGNQTYDDQLSALSEATATLPPNVVRELRLLSRGKNITTVQAGMGQISEQHSAISSSMLLMARVYQDKVCPYNPMSTRRKSVLLYHVGAMEAHHPSTSDQSYITVEPPVPATTMADNFEQLANAGPEASTDWSSLVTLHKNAILSHANHGGAYGVIAEP